jgi:hypothetical protein
MELIGPELTWGEEQTVEQFLDYYRAIMVRGDLLHDWWVDQTPRVLVPGGLARCTGAGALAR